MKTLQIHIANDGKPTKPGSVICDWILKNTEPGKSYTLGLQKRGDIRSLQFNRYLWGCIYFEISEWNGDKKEDIHEFCKWKFNPIFIKTPEGEEIRTGGTTTTMSTKRFNQFIDEIVYYFNTEHGIRFEEADSWLASNPEPYI
jgi:hypothetical protein